MKRRKRITRKSSCAHPYHPDCPDCNVTDEQTARKLWEAFCRSGKKPKDIPARPDLVYADEWLGWCDWIWGDEDDILA